MIPVPKDVVESVPGQTATSHSRWMSAHSHNRTLALPKEVAHWSLTTLREKLVKIGAKVVNHGRYVTFQLAKVAVPRELFQKNPPPHRWVAAGPFAAMTGLDPEASRRLDRTGVCCASRSAPSPRKMAIGQES